MKKFKDKHQELPIHETQFFKFIKEEPNKRELQNKDIFKTVNLNVELPKFKQYYFQVNIATFQSEFQKIHLKQIPRRMLGDVLNNNYLQNDMKEIW